MNTTNAIEAAKIAAETASRNAVITTIVAIITLLITSGISIWSVTRNNKIAKELGEKNIKSGEQNRYIDAISQERIKWINIMRDRFSEFLKVIHIQISDIKGLQDGKGNVDEKLVEERFYELSYISNNIRFLLNPTEPVCKEIGKLQKRVIRATRKGSISNFDSKQVIDSVQDLAYFYQVVLKAEWKRVKEENKKGEKIDDETMEKIYIMVEKNKSYKI
ncbi:hypothetical protein COD94_30675 [Bacillus cereus]|nr:hypothetical protein COD94_30675 [Bacillus cereus]